MCLVLGVRIIFFFGIFPFAFHSAERGTVVTFGLGIVDDYLSETCKHDKQTDAAQAEFACQSPQEDEQSDAEEDVFDATAAQITIFNLFEEIGR